MFEKIKKYGLTVAGAFLISIAGGEYLRSNDHYYPEKTAIVIEDNKITKVYSDEPARIENKMSHIINEQGIELYSHDGSIETTGQVIEIPWGTSLEPFMQAKFNSIPYERNGLMVNYDIDLDVAARNPDELFIRYGSSGYNDALSDVKDLVDANISHYLAEVLDSLSDEDYELLARYSNDALSLSDTERYNANIINSIVERDVDNKLFTGLNQSMGLVTDINIKAYLYSDYVNYMNSGATEGNSNAYLLGEDYITELTDVPGWVGHGALAGIILLFSGMSLIGYLNLKTKIKHKNDENGLFSDGEIIEHVKRTLPQETAELVDPAAYAEEQLKALNKST